jgi:serine protease AprX
LDPFVGELNAGMIYLDLTGSRAWTWADFDSNIELKFDQTHFETNHYVYYDAVGLRVTKMDGLDNSGGVQPTSETSQLIDVNKLNNVYNRAVRASDVWNEAPGYYQGQGVSVAVVDSGILPNKDLKKRIIQRVNFNSEYHNSHDGYGHGTFVSGIIAGDGKLSSGRFVGVAPKTNIINVRVSDDVGASTESDVVSGLQWILEHKAEYNIRVVNMSLNSSVAQSYHTSPMDAAVEILWFNGIVVVVSAGNNGTANLFPPANDPFVITVGATDDRGTLSMADDTIAGFSAYGTTEIGTAKPEIVAPGRRIVGVLPRHGVLTMSREHTSAQVNSNYFRMSGTSLSAPMVSGAVALLLQAQPNLNPDQVKYRLMATAAKAPAWPGYNPTTGGAGYLDIYAALHSNTSETANTGTRASQLLWTGPEPINWGSINWNSINWGSINWNSINWGSINWNSINWNSDHWDQ